MELVRQTIGYDEGRGDTVSVIDSDFFSTADEHVFVAEESLLDNPLLWSGLKHGAAALVVLFLIFGVLRPVLKSSVADASSLPTRQMRLAGPDAADDSREMAAGEDRVSLSAPAQQGLPAATAMASYEQNLQQVRSIVDTEPERAARLIQGWVADDNG